MDSNLYLYKKVMANFDTLKNSIDENINTNGKQEITGKKLNSVLNQMVSGMEDINGEVAELETFVNGGFDGLERELVGYVEETTNALTHLNQRVDNCATQTDINNAIANAITTTLNTAV